jgi:uncharacterized protein YcbK (DUF882 family)
VSAELRDTVGEGLRPLVLPVAIEGVTMASDQLETVCNTAATRRVVVCGLASFAAMTTAPAAASAPAIVKGAGNFRSLHLVNARTGEWLRTVYWVEGEYVGEALQAINDIMRDWREDRVHEIAPRTIDILSATYRLLDCAEPYHLVSGYRCPKTNAMLRHQSKGVARNSYHVKGMAADIQLKTRSAAQISRAGLSLRAGGVGTYSRSKFVHLDSGPVRAWGC